MPEEKLQTLSLQVINGSELESGRAARCLFTQQGNVGHAPECHWSVQDRQHSIPAQAFTIILHDGTFCLRPQTVQLWLNQAKVTATSDLIQLRQGDEIQIGRLMMWEHALGWLKEKRARQPLNGIILTLDLPDLLTADKRRREHLLQALRSRLQDIRQHLHCQLPVYVVLTRLDLLQGFAALFQSLNRQDRDAILGVTFTRRAHEMMTGEQS